MKNLQQTKVLFMAQAAMIAAVYTVLTLLGASFSYGEVQVRISEALTILPVFTPAAIPGLFIGCLLSNILGGCIIPDVIFGSLATLIGAFFTWKIRNLNKFLAPLPPIVSNISIVPFVLKYGYQLPFPIPFMMLTVGIGEIVSCGVLGIVLYTALNKYFIQKQVLKINPDKNKAFVYGIKASLFYKAFVLCNESFAYIFFF